MATVALVEALAPEFVGDTRVAAFIELATARMHAVTWGTLYSQGAAYLAAHLLAMAPSVGRGPPGPITSEKALDLARSYGMPAVDPSDYGYLRSSYGASYLQLRDELGAVGAQVICI
jgi:hypothetical protein